MESSAPIRPEPWLAHAGWMRALAAHLLADPADVDEVVQDACVAAWKRLEEERSGARSEAAPAGRRLEPWLARVVRNLARKRQRGAARRHAHEEARPPLVSVPTPAETVQRLDLQRVLIEEVRALEEPLRTTILLRYFEERTSAAIAAAEGIPEGTVRWRVKRALADLRARLDRRLGGREGWAALVSPLGALPAPTAAATPAPRAPAPGAKPLATVPQSTLVATGVQGVLLMSALVKSIAAVGVVTIVAAVWWTAHDASPRRVPALELAPTREDAVVAAVAFAAGETPLPASAREAAPEPVAPIEASAGASAPKTPAVGSAVPPARVDVRFVDAEGGAWEGVRFECRDKLVALSSSDGRAELELPWTWQGKSPHAQTTQETFVARRKGCATLALHASIWPGTTTHLGEVLLGPGSRVLGRVVDEQGTLGLKGARVGLCPVEIPADDPDRRARLGSKAFDLVTSAEIEGDGTFVLEGVAPGRWRLWAHADGSRYAWTAPFEVEEGRDATGLEIALTGLLDEDRIAGIVLDPEGQPVPRAELTFAHTLDSEVGIITEVADERGRFDYLIWTDAVYGIVASDPEDRFDSAVASGVRPGMLDLEIRLRPRSLLDVRVLGSGERPVEGAAFQVSIETEGTRVSEGYEPDELRSGAGRYRLPTPPLRFDLDVRAPGFRPRLLAGLDPAMLAQPLEIVLEPAHVFRGRVVFEGRAVGGARVLLRRLLQDERVLWNGFECLVDHHVLSQVTSDEAGRFELSCEVDSEVIVRALGTGLAAGETGPLDPTRAGAELVIELTRGGVIEGRVLVDEGSGEGIIVGINRGDVAPRTMRAGPEGRFRFEGLTPGAWQVLVREQELEPGGITIDQSKGEGEQPEFESSCEVQAGRTTLYDLDLRKR